jgi:hypothetical protein
LLLGISSDAEPFFFFSPSSSPPCYLCWQPTRPSETTERDVLY